eukprot:SAG11_NODE_24949_length_365_cov_2.037594_1_plen_64_part_10
MRTLPLRKSFFVITGLWLCALFTRWYILPNRAIGGERLIRALRGHLPELNRAAAAMLLERYDFE